MWQLRYRIWHTTFLLSHPHHYSLQSKHASPRGPNPGPSMSQAGPPPSSHSPLTIIPNTQLSTMQSDSDSDSDDLRDLIVEQLKLELQLAQAEKAELQRRVDSQSAYYHTLVLDKGRLNAQLKELKKRLRLCTCSERREQPPVRSPPPSSRSYSL